MVYMKSICLSLLLVGCASAPPASLPHRTTAETRVFEQGHTSLDCPNQYPDYIVAEDGTVFFLECWGKK